MGCGKLRTRSVDRFFWWKPMMGSVGHNQTSCVHGGFFGGAIREARRAGRPSYPQTDGMLYLFRWAKTMR